MAGKDDVLVIGAGPAGLTAAYELARHGIAGTIVEAEDVVGGLARTVERDGYRFDIGAHRFFTKVSEIERLWEEMLGQPMLKCRRLTRILYDGRFYDYPLKARNALGNMGLLSAGLCMLSYFKARLRPIRQPRNFEQWVINQFGARLYNMFFKSYTEKVWGCPCTQIGADWAAQRIKTLNLGQAVRDALLGKRKGHKTIVTLIDQFKYPPRGAGQLWEACARKVQEMGWRLQTRTRVTGIEVENRRIRAVLAAAADGRTAVHRSQHVLSTMPLRTLLLSMDPVPPPAVLEAASKLSYRDFLLVALVVDRPDVFPDNWIYVHSGDVRVARIDNFGNWTPHMVPDKTTSCLVMEYFVFENDELWSRPDDELIRFAYNELNHIGLSPGKLLRGYVVRVPKAYPIYDPLYKGRLSIIRNWLGANIGNLQCLGRNGQHRYNNQDHSMATALIAARNIIYGRRCDPWAVNEQAEYHEIAQTQREAPMTPIEPAGVDQDSDRAGDDRFGVAATVHPSPAVEFDQVERVLGSP